MQLTQTPGPCHTREVTHGHYLVSGEIYYADQYFTKETVVTTACKEGYVASQPTVKCLESMFWETFSCIKAGKIICCLCH